MVTGLAAVSAALLAAFGAAESRATSHVTSSTGGSIAGIVDIFTKLNEPGAAAAGTGIVLTSSGEILTNNHVIRGSTSIEVTVLDTGKKYKGTVVGYSLANDIAVVQLQSASGLTTAPLGSSGTIKAGDAVTGMGNAGGAGGAPSLAAGKVISLDNSLQVSDDEGGSEQLHGLIQTDAPLQPGDSGGPLVNTGGKVVGIDTAASSSFSFDSGNTRGFAIPINHARTLAAQIVAGHKSSTIHIGQTAFLGVAVQPQNDFFGSTDSGLIISRVVPGSPTAKIGLQSGDVLTRFDGKAINSLGNLTAIVVTKYPGDTVPVRWVDVVGTAHTASLKLSSGPPQ
jgi:S1-C subfamily serine protease